MPAISPTQRADSTESDPSTTNIRQSLPLVMRELSSVDSSPLNLRYFSPWLPTRLKHWLAQLFNISAEDTQPEDIEMANELSEILISPQDTEINTLPEARTLLQEEENAANQTCPHAGKIVAAFAAITVAGTLVPLLARRTATPSAENALSLTGHNDTPHDLSFGNGLPQVDAVIGRQSTLARPSSLRRDERIAALLNTTRDGLQLQFPGIKMKALEDALISPQLKMLMDSLASQPLTAAHVARLTQQLSMMVDILFTTLTSEEHLRLFRADRAAGDNKDISGRFTARDGYAHVNIDRQEFRLWSMASGTPFITDEEGRCRFIRFNQKKSCWEFVREADNEIYSADNRKFIEKRHVSLSKAPATMTMKLNDAFDTIETSEPFFGFTKGLFLQGAYLPLGNYAYTGQTTELPPEPRICQAPLVTSMLKKNSYGWYPDLASVKMDEYLSLLLKNTDICVKNVAQRPLSAINSTTGLVSDRDDNLFIKKDYKLFNVLRTGDAAHEHYNLTLPDFSDAIIKNHNGTLFLEHSDEIAFALKNTKVKNTVVSSKPFHIETDAINYLQEHALTTAILPTDSLSSRYPGIWSNIYGEKTLIIQDEQFAVREYSRDAIRITHREYPEKRENDIVLFLVGDTLLRIRPDDENIQYVAMVSLENYTDVSFDKDLYLQLQSYMNDYDLTEVQPASNKLINIDGFTLPLVWLDTQNWHQWFLYNGTYFPARILSAANLANPSGLDCIKVYNNGDFFTQQKQLATVVMQDTEGGAKINTMSNYLAENLGISTDVINVYLKKSPWRHYADMRSVEDAVSKMLSTGYLYVAPVGPSVKKEYTTAETNTQRKFLRRYLYPGHINVDQLKLRKLTDEKNANDSGKKKLHQTIKNTVNLVKNELLTTLDKSLYYNTLSWPTVRYYLTAALGNNSDEFQSAYAVAWRKHLQKITNRLNPDKIHLAFGKNIKLTAEEKKSGRLVAISPVDGNIYINTHKIDSDDAAQVRLVAELIHAAALAENSMGGFPNIKLDNGMYIPVKDAGEALAEELRLRKLTPTQLANIQAISKKFLAHIPAYRQQIDFLLAPEKLAYLATFDPAYKGHLFLHNAPLFTLSTLDICYLLASKQIITDTAAPWIIRYAELRTEHCTPWKPQSPGSVTTESQQKTSTISPGHFPGVRVPTKYEPGVRPSNSGQQRPGGILPPYPTASPTEPPEDSEEQVDESDEEPDDVPEAESDEEPGDVPEEEPDDVPPQEAEDRSPSRSGGSGSWFGRRPPLLPWGLPPVPPVLGPPGLPGLPGLPGGSPARPGPPPASPFQNAAGQAAGGGAIVGAGVGIGAGIPRNKGNSTISNNADNGTTTLPPETHAHNRDDQFFRHPHIHDKKPPDADSRDDVFIPETDITATQEKQKPDYALAPKGSRHPTLTTFRQKQGASTTETKVMVPGHGLVTMVEIPELACLGEKELTVAGMLRMYGEALQNPVVANALAHQEDYHLEILSGTCPSVEDTKWLAERASVFDAIIDTAMAFIPVLWPVSALKTLLGPTLVLIADAIEGKEVSAADVIYLLLNAISQAFSAFNTDIPTLRSVDRSRLLNKPLRSDTNFFKKLPAFKHQTTFNKDAQPHINIKQKEYILKTTDDQTQVIHNDKESTRLVKFNQQENQWEILKNHNREDDAEATRNQYLYKMSLTEYAGNTIIDLGIDDVVTIKSIGKPDVTGVFIGMDFIPASIENIGNEVVAYTTKSSIPHELQRLLVHNKFGWNFEIRSTKIDNNLAVLLTGNDGVGINNAQTFFGAIRQSDGLSYDSLGNPYLKKDYLYYRVNKITTGDITSEIKFHGYPNAIAKFNNGYYSLISSDDMIFPLKIKEVMSKQNKIRIEEATLEYLRHFAEKASPDANPDSVIAIDGYNYLLNSRSGRKISIVRKSEHDNSDIILWSDTNAWLRVRDEMNNVEFEDSDIILCRSARSPGSGHSCSGDKISIDREVTDLLHQQIRNGRSSTPVSDKLTAVRKNEIPFLYQNKKANKYYFKFYGKLFNAKVIEKSDWLNNFTEYPCLELSGQSDFFSLEQKIVTVVIVKEGSSLKVIDEIKYLSGKTHITRQQAALFKKNRNFIKMRDADELEKLVNKAQLAESHYVEQPENIATPPPGKELTAVELYNAAVQALYPKDLLVEWDYSIEVYELSNSAEAQRAYVRQSVEFLKQQVDFIQDSMLMSVIKSFAPDSYDNPLVEDYLAEILNSNDIDFLNDIQTALYSRLISVRDKLKSLKIKLISLVETTEGAKSIHLKDANRVVYFNSNNDDTIFINIDVLDIADNAKHLPVRDVTGAIIDAALLATGKTNHLFDLPIKNGIYPHIKDIYNYLITTIKDGDLTREELTPVRNVISRYLQKTPEYHSRQDILQDIPDDWRKFAYLLQNDSAFRAHLSFNFDNILTSIIQDMHYRLAVYHQDVFILHPWVKKYGERRAVSTYHTGTEQLTNAFCSPYINLESLGSVDFGTTNIEPVPGKKNIFRATEFGMFIKWENNYYPLTFIGKHGRMVEIGQPDEMRHVYYYEPQTGSLGTIPSEHGYANMIDYFSELDLYQLSNTINDYSEIFRYDIKSQKLISTGAIQVIRMPDQVTRIEFPGFTLFHPQDAARGIYIQGHGKLLPTQHTIPANIDVSFYTAKGHQLVPYKGSTVDLLSDRFVKQETQMPGTPIDNYLINPFQGTKVNHYHLAKEFKKNIIYVFSPSTTTEKLMDGVSNIFTGENMELHLYMCRIIGGDKSAVSFIPHERAESSDQQDFRRWSFDQQITGGVAGGSLDALQSLKEFTPLKEMKVYLRPGTIDMMVAKTFNSLYDQEPFTVYRGLDISEAAKNRIPPYILNTRIQLRNAMARLKTNLEIATSKLRDPAHQVAIKSYLAYVYDTTEPAIIELISARLDAYISRVYGYVIESREMGYRNIDIASSDKTEDPQKPGTYKSKIDERIPLKAFTISGDALRRLFIIDDTFPREGTSLLPASDVERNQDHIIAHEASHIAGTLDNVYICDSTNQIIDPRGGITNLDNLLDNGTIKNTHIWKHIISNMLKNLKIENPSEQDIIDIIKKSPLIKANIIADNADSFAKILVDLPTINAESRSKRETSDYSKDIDSILLTSIFYATAEHHI